MSWNNHPFIVPAARPSSADEGPLAWMSRGRCLTSDPDMFTPPKPGASTRDPKAVCAKCEVSTECLLYALATGQSGVWGGTSDRERRKMQTRERPARTTYS